MFKQIMSSALVVIFASSFVGCGGNGPEVKPIAKLDKKIVKYNFPEIDPATNKKAVINYGDMSNAIVSLSNYKEFELTSGVGMNNGKGVKIDAYSNYFNIKYLNGEVPVGNTNDEKYLSQVIFSINYSTDNEKVTFTFPTSYTYIKSKHPFGMTAKTLDTFSELEADAKNMFNNLDKIFILAEKTYKLEGEVNSKYPATSIYANFKRIMGEYNWSNYENISEAKKSNTFNLKFKNEYLPIKIEVYPYREGSKAKYSVVLPYTLNSNGEGTLTQKEIKNIKAEIEKVVND